MEPAALIPAGIAIASAAVKAIYDVAKLRSDVAAMRVELNGKLDRRLSRMEESIEMIWRHLAGGK